MSNQDAAAKTLLAKMGYTDDSETCSNCAHFEGCDMSGAHDAKDAHCTIAKVIDLPVQPGGRCKEWAKKHDSSVDPPR